jgi:hypothetical protein
MQPIGTRPQHEEHDIHRTHSMLSTYIQTAVVSRAILFLLGVVPESPTRCSLFDILGRALHSRGIQAPVARDVSLRSSLYAPLEAAKWGLMPTLAATSMHAGIQRSPRPISPRRSLACMHRRLTPQRLPCGPRPWFFQVQ